MSQQTAGYRSFPEKFPHPARARRYSAAEFSALEKQEMQTAPGCCKGHESTTIWYTGHSYVVEVQFSAHAPSYIESICTFTPTMGMDMIDGNLAQDAEEFVLQQVLSRPTQRLMHYGLSGIPALEYLKLRGFAK